MSILLVDDDEGSRYSLTKTLTAAGFDVKSAPDYREALEILSGTVQIELLITDVIMPDRVHGFALARMARMRRPNLPVIYITAYDVPVEEAIGTVLRKPVDDARLVQEARNAIARAGTAT